MCNIGELSWGVLEACNLSPSGECHNGVKKNCFYSMLGMKVRS
jgi:hypothetical protein